MSQKHLRNLFFVIVLFISASVVAQGEATMLFLRIHPSPEVNSRGEAGVALPTTDPLGFFYNPAQIGYASQQTNLAFQFYPGAVDWLPRFKFYDLTYNSLAFNAGYNLTQIFNELPLSLGFGYMRNEFNYGDFVLVNTQGEPIGTWESRESADAFAFGLNFDSFINVSVGLIYKDISSKLSPVVITGSTEIGLSKAEAEAIDYGFLVSIPLLKFFEKDMQNTSLNETAISPYFNISIGYAKTNIGDKVSNRSAQQSDPLLRTALLGYGMSAGFSSEFNRIPFYTFISGLDS